MHTTAMYDESIGVFVTPRPSHTQGVQALRCANHTPVFTVCTDYYCFIFALMQDGATPLYVASLEGREGVVKLLLEKGANIDQQDKV